MKKKLFLLPIYGLLLTGCIYYNGSNPEESESESSLPASSSEIISSSESGAQSQSSGESESSQSSSQVPLGDNVKVYLVLTQVGQFEGQSGQNFPELFLENAVEYIAPAGSTLPGKDKVTVTSGTGEFEAWVTYEGTGAPTVQTLVPSESGTILYAKFKDSGVPYVPVQPGEESVFYFTNNYCWSDLHIYFWGASGEKTTWDNAEALTSSQKNNHGEDVYQFTTVLSQYDHCIISGFDSGKGEKRQTVNVDLSSFGSSNNFYITNWVLDGGSEKADVGLAVFKTADAN